LLHTGLAVGARELIRYNQAHPDAAHRIITMAEKEGAHRQKLETLGLFFGFVIVVTVIGAGALVKLCGGSGL
jgi:hypothetical protein